jgi:hypothetical protein
MGGRGGVAGGAFSLSVVCDSWLDMAFWGRGVVLASAVEVEGEDAGGFGNSLTIWTCRQMWRRPGRRIVLPHPGDAGYT